MEGNVTEYLNFVDGVVSEHGQNVHFFVVYAGEKICSHGMFGEWRRRELLGRRWGVSEGYSDSFPCPIGCLAFGQSSVLWLFPAMSPWLRSGLVVSSEVPSAWRVGLMAGLWGFASNGVVHLHL